MSRFKRPIKNIEQQDTFSGQEIGLTHPNLSSFIRLSNNGDVEIVVNDNLAIVLHKHTSSITFVADSIKFLTKDGDNIRWNNSKFNSRAVNYAQPALIPLNTSDMNSLYDGA